jgi:hypothetical protein
MSETRRLPLAAVKLDPAIQQRVEGTSQTVVGEYADAMRAGDVFPPVIVFSNDGIVHHLGDGFHRFDAYRLAHPDAQTIDCEVRPGDHEDAVLFACGANASHGLRRSNADKKKAVLRLLNSEKWSQGSDREIARHCKVSPPFVAKVRSEHLKEVTDAGQKDQAARISPTNASVVARDRRRSVTRGGITFGMNTAAIGSRPAKRSLGHNVEAKPFTSLAWSEAPEFERAKISNGIGLPGFVDAFKMNNPGFDTLNWAWAASGQAERQAFAKEHQEEINALAEARGSAIAGEPSETPTDTPRQLCPGEDPLDIPTFLRRGHPDCPVKMESPAAANRGDETVFGCKVSSVVPDQECAS